MSATKIEEFWLLFDGRASGGFGTDDALVLVTCDSEDEARDFATDYGECACYKLHGEEEEWLWDRDEKGFSDK